jgi:hypothetical protein
LHYDISLAAVLYKKETWFLLLWKDRPMVFESGVLKRICGRRTEEMTGRWTKLCIEKLCDVDSSSVIRLISEEV